MTTQKLATRPKSDPNSSLSFNGEVKINDQTTQKLDQKEDVIEHSNFC